METVVEGGGWRDKVTAEGNLRRGVVQQWGWAVAEPIPGRLRASADSTPHQPDLRVRTSRIEQLHSFASRVTTSDSKREITCSHTFTPVTRPFYPYLDTTTCRSCISAYCSFHEEPHPAASFSSSNLFGQLDNLIIPREIIEWEQTRREIRSKNTCRFHTSTCAAIIILSSPPVPFPPRLPRISVFCAPLGRNFHPPTRTVTGYAWNYCLFGGWSLYSWRGFFVCLVILYIIGVYL